MKHEAKLLNIAVALLSGGKTVKVKKEAAIEALEWVISAAHAELYRLTAEERNAALREQGKVRAEERARKEEESRRVAEAARASAERSEQRREEMRADADEHARGLAKARTAIDPVISRHKKWPKDLPAHKWATCPFEEAYSVQIGVAPQEIGDVWYHELPALREAGLFTAALCDQLLRHAQPAAPTKVRDLVKAPVLAEMIEKARRVARSNAIHKALDRAVGMLDSALRMGDLTDEVHAECTDAVEVERDRLLGVTDATRWARRSGLEGVGF